MFQLKRISTAAFAAIFVLTTAAIVSAQIRSPQASQKASVMQTVGVTDISVVYYRPAVKGRKVFGDWPTEVKGEATLDNQNARPKDAVLVPWGHVWRTGANDATQFTVTDDVLINGQPLPAGTYSLHTIPTKEEWTIVFNSTANQWGSFDYDASKDTLRVKTKPQWMTDSQELLAFNIDPVTEKSATINIRWEKVNVPFTVEVKDVNATVFAHAKTSVAAAKADDWRTPFQAAAVAKQNSDAKSAAEWNAQALKAVDASIASKKTYQNLVGKTNILLALDKKEDAFKTADEAIAQGKMDKADTSAFEKKIATLKAAK